MDRCIPPEMLETRRRYIDKAVKASRALQAGLITGGEFDSICNLTSAWYRYIRWLYEPRRCSSAALERLTSNKLAVVEGLHQAGYYNLASQVERDIEALAEQGV